MSVSAIVLAGGSGSRMGTAIKKQFLTLHGRPMLCHSLSVFADCDLVDDIVIVAAEEDVAYVEKEIVAREGYTKVRDIVAGGAARYHSVYAGLKALHDESADPVNQVVLIHDSARPYVTEDILRRVHDGVRQYGACVAAMPVKDTIKQADADHFVTHTPDRRTLWMMQTPQAFTLTLAYEAYERLIAAEAGALADGVQDYGADITDDAMVVERFFPAQKIYLTEGSYANIKITTKEDML